MHSRPVAGVPLRVILAVAVAAQDVGELVTCAADFTPHTNRGVKKLPEQVVTRCSEGTYTESGA